MSSSTESRIITMKFENSQLLQGVQSTMSALDKLKASMNIVTTPLTKGMGMISSAFGKLGFQNPFSKASQGATDLTTKASFFSRLNPFSNANRGVSELQRATNGFSMQTLEGGVTGVSKSFLAMSTIAITALSNITSKAITAGSQFVKSFTTAPITAGLKEYETNLNSVQTILANTKVSGANLDDVNRALNELNKYSDRTIYNFSEMARNIGTFTAAGVDLDTATSSIKGIANLAALSGSNSQQASTAMYQLSQEIAAGRVSLQGWNSVVNAGMGGSTFQRALVKTADNMGTLRGKTVEFTGKMKNATIDGKSFRDSIMAKPGEQSWLTSKVLTNTLEQFTGDMSRADLANQGFSKSAINAIMDQAQVAKDAATKVKTLSGVIDTAKEVAGSGWAKTWQLIFGDFKEARTLFTDVSNQVNDFIGGMSKNRNDILKIWNDMGGRDLLIKNLGKVFNSLKRIITPIHDAFRDMFPPATAQGLMGLTRAVGDFAKAIRPSNETMGLMKSTFSGVFAILSIGIQVVKAIAGMFVNMFSAIGSGSGGFLKFTAGVGNFLVALDAMLKKSGVLEAFFNGLGSILAIPLKLLGAVGRVLAGLFTGFDADGANKLGTAFDKAGKRMEPLAAAGERIKSVFQGIGDFFGDVADKIGQAFGGIGDAIAGAITEESFGHALDVINTGLLGGIILMIKNFINGGLGKLDVSGGLFDSVKETLGSVTQTMQNMQQSLKADILLKIAASLAILAASITLLSLIDPKRLASALAAMTASFIGLQVALKTLASSVGVLGSLKLPALVIGIMGIATAMLILSGAIKVLSTIPLFDLAKGLGGVAAAMFIMTKAVGPLTANASGMIRVGAGLILVAVALRIMASAVKAFASMDLLEMARGLGGVAASLGILAAGMRLMPTGMVAQAAALLILGAALKVIGSAVSQFAAIGWGGMVTGFTGLAVALGVMAVAMRLMPTNMLIQAVALGIVATAINVLALAVQQMAGMSLAEVATGLGVLAGSLVILAAGLTLMSGTLVGSLALTIAAGALALLAPVLLALGAMSWEAIAQGLTMLAGVFVVLGVAGMVLTPVIPMIFALSASMLVLGAGLALAGAGALAFSLAFGAVVAAASVGVAVLSTILQAIIGSIPKALQAFGQGIVKFAGAIAKGAGAFFRAFGAILSGLIRAVVQAIPKIGQMFLKLVETALRVISVSIPKFIAVGFKLIISFLNSISKNVGKIVNIASDIIVKFLNGISRNIGKIIQSGVTLIIKFINGITQALNNNSARLGTAGGELAVALVRGMANGISNMASVVMEAAGDLASRAVQSIKDKIKMFSPSRVTHHIGEFFTLGFANGISNRARDVTSSAGSVATAAVDTMRSAMGRVSEAVRGELDVNPTIAPVLDLGQVRSEASRMAGIFGEQKLGAGVSYQQASALAAQQRAAAEAMGDTAATPPVQEIKFEQTINAPTEISPTTIFRGTRSQLAMAKEALKTA